MHFFPIFIKGRKYRRKKWFRCFLFKGFKKGMSLNETVQKRACRMQKESFKNLSNFSNYEQVIASTFPLK